LNSLKIYAFPCFSATLNQRKKAAPLPYLCCMSLKIGLTGGIGSGKTTIAKLFELLQVPVYYADAASKRLYQTDQALQSALKQHFGEDIYTGGQLDRSKLASIVFADKAKLALLNSLVHPPTIKDAEEWIKKQTAPYVIKEAALLFETGSVAGLDLVVGVYAPPHLRIKRVMDRDGIGREDIQNRMAKQIDENIKMRLCDVVITNDEQQLVIPQVLQVHQKLIQLAAETKGAVFA
jgi:dephospho-CoA kinase